MRKITWYPEEAHRSGVGYWQHSEVRSCVLCCSLNDVEVSLSLDDETSVEKSILSATGLQSQIPKGGQNICMLGPMQVYYTD